MKKSNLSAASGFDYDEKNFCLLPSAFCLSGFTLIETLVALIIVTVTVSVVLGSQLVSLKIEQKARAFQLFRFETERIFAVTRCADNEQQLTEWLASNNLCRVKFEKVQIEMGTNVLNFVKYELNPEDLPAFSSVFYVRFPDYPVPGEEATGGAGAR